MSVGEILLDILIVIVAAKLAAEVAERLKIPPVVGEICAGIVIGPSVLGMVGHVEVLTVLGEIGVILLLLQVGLEMDIGELAAVGRASLLVAIIGVVVPMATGFGVAEVFGYDFNTALFLGAALAATSVGITARVFSDLGALASVEARTVLGAAVADDVMGLVILTVVVRIVTEGTVSVLTVLGIVGVAVGFLVITAALGGKLGPPLFRWVQHNARSAGTLVAVALAFTLAFAQLAEAAQLAPIVGAFVAGLALSRSEQRERIERELTPVGHLFIPVFFLEIGISIDVGSFADGRVLQIAAALFVVAVVGKLVAAFGAFGSPGDKRLIGLGMLPRGEVGLIFATIGLREGVLGDDLYAALLLVVLATTLVTPPLLRWRLVQLRADRRPRVGTGEPMPEGGWLRIDEGAVELAGEPPDRAALQIALDAALLIAAGARPGRTLLDWLGELGDEPLRWDDDATQRLFEVLTRGNERTWRFLETTGVLDRALPELAEAFRRRRADPYLTDPYQVLRFSLVDRVHELVHDDEAAAAVHEQLEHPEWLLLAALLLETAGEDTEPVEPARRLVKRLDLGAAAEQEIALLVGDSGLLRAAASRVDGLDEEAVLQLGTHLDQPERVRALYLLSLAIGELEPVERKRLDELVSLILATMEHTGLTGLEARNLVERRRAEAIRIVGEKTQAADRIGHAPRAYLLALEAEDIARQADFVEPVPPRGEARVLVLEIAPHEWRLEVASRDRPGLMARVSGVLADHGLDVLDANAATWGDGAAIESFRVQRAPLEPPQLETEAIDRASPPDSARLARAIAESFRDELSSPANPDAEITFDDAASPWYTLCEVRSPDRRGLLHTITVGLAHAGASVHSARLVTIAGKAVDRFELTDANGRKLDKEIKDGVRLAIVGGVSPKRRRGKGRRPLRAAS